MPLNRIAADFSAEQREKAKAALAKALPRLIDLSADERRNMAKFGEKNRTYIAAMEDSITGMEISLPGMEARTFRNEIPIAGKETSVDAWEFSIVEMDERFAGKEACIGGMKVSLHGFEERNFMNQRRVGTYPCPTPLSGISGTGTHSRSFSRTVGWVEFAKPIERERCASRWPAHPAALFEARKNARWRYRIIHKSVFLSINLTRHPETIPNSRTVQTTSPNRLGQVL